MNKINPLIDSIKTKLNLSTFKNKKVLIGGGLVLLLVVVSVTAFLKLNQKTPTNSKNNPVLTFDGTTNNGPFPPNQKMAQIGTETIYGSDLNYVLLTNYPKNKFTDQQAKDVAIKSVATTSAILQAAKAQNIVSVPETLFTINKDQLARVRLTKQIRDKITAESTKYTASAISIWYYDSQPPSVPEDQARLTAQTKIGQLYKELKAGSITMKQAGDRIKSDTNLSKLDKNYQNNAYSNKTDWTADFPPFGFSTLDNAVQKLASGQISDIIEITKTADFTEKFFVIVSMDNIKVGKYPSLGEWVAQATLTYMPSLTSN